MSCEIRDEFKSQLHSCFGYFTPGNEETKELHVEHGFVGTG